MLDVCLASCPDTLKNGVSKKCNCKQYVLLGVRITSVIWGEMLMLNPVTRIKGARSRLNEKIYV